MDWKYVLKHRLAILVLKFITAYTQYKNSNKMSNPLNQKLKFKKDRFVTDIYKKKFE